MLCPCLEEQPLVLVPQAMAFRLQLLRRRRIVTQSIKLALDLAPLSQDGFGELLERHEHPNLMPPFLNGRRRGVYPQVARV